MAPSRSSSSPNIGGIKNIFALSIICFTMSAMKNFHVTSMSIGASGGGGGGYGGDLDNENLAANYMEELSMRRSRGLELPSSSSIGETGDVQDGLLLLGKLEPEVESYGDSILGTRDQALSYDDDDQLENGDELDQSLAAAASAGGWRNKRFLGTMARGNWFPRPFRRFIDSDMYPGSDLTRYKHIALLTYPEKKHVGRGVTRVKLLSMPSSSSSAFSPSSRKYVQDYEDEDDDDEEEDKKK